MISVRADIVDHIWIVYRSMLAVTSSKPATMPSSRSSAATTAVSAARDAT